MVKKKLMLLMLVIFFLFMIINFSGCVNTMVTPGTEENAPEETHTCTNGLCLDYYLTLEGDVSNRPHMVLKISNIQGKEYLNLVISWPLLDDNSNPDPSLFTMIHNISVTDSEGNKLPIEFSQKSFIGSNWSFSYLGFYIYYDILTIYTNGNSEITIEYDLASNVEIWTGLGGSINNPRDSEYFWAVYLENILYRPEGHQFIEAAYLNINLPSGWNFATVYPRYGNTVELGTMDYMYGDNVRWMNYQRGGLILFKEGPFILESENIYGVEVMDVYTKDYAGDRCHEANYQYFEYFCDHIGILPVDGVLTFCPSIDANKIPLASIFQSAPYGSPHSLMGEYIGAGGDLAIASGGELTQVPLWDLYSFSDEKTYGLYMHGVVRYWIDRFIQLETVDEEWFKCGFGNYYENMAVSSKYGYGQIKERRFKPMYEFYKENINHLETCIESGGHDFLRYCKPALVAYYINELLKEQSNSEKCLDDAMQILFDNAYMGESITKYGFIYALNSLTDYDFTNIVNDYIYGNNKALDLDKYFY
jgi:hypothetical protein